MLLHLPWRGLVPFRYLLFVGFDKLKCLPDAIIYAVKAITVSIISGSGRAMHAATCISHALNLDCSLLSEGQDEAWDSVKQMCMKADRKHLWAIRDAEFRIQV